MTRGLEAVRRADGHVRHVGAGRGLAQETTGVKSGECNGEREMVIASNVGLRGELPSHAARDSHLRDEPRSRRFHTAHREHCGAKTTPIDYHRQSTCGRDTQARGHVNRVCRADETRAPRIHRSWKQRVERLQGGIVAHRSSVVRSARTPMRVGHLDDLTR
jgi:hypothetical protein